MMWAIFSNSLPQNAKINNIFKQTFIKQQVESLTILQSSVKLFHLTISNLLRQSTLITIAKQNKKNHVEQDQTSDLRINQALQTVKHNLHQMMHHLAAKNQQYTLSVEMRNLQKQYDHIFFKTLILNYDQKRKQLKEDIYKLENLVQQKQNQTQYTHRTFRTNCETNDISGPLSCQMSEEARFKVDIRIKKYIIIKNLLQKRRKLIEEKGVKDKELFPIIGQFEKNQYAGISNLVNMILRKQKYIEGLSKERLKKQQLISNNLSEKNNRIKEGIAIIENELKLKEQQKYINLNIDKQKRSSCIEYLKELHKRIKIKFKKGINFKRKVRSKSCIIKINIQETRDKELDHSTKAKKPINLYEEDITVSLSQHLDYIISEKLIHQDQL